MLFYEEKNGTERREQRDMGVVIKRRGSKIKKGNPTLDDYPSELRGFAQNRWGGQQTQRLRHYRGKFGPASECKKLTREEIEKLDIKINDE